MPGKFLRVVWTSLTVLGYARSWIALPFSPFFVALHPFAMGVFVYAAIRSACVALAKGGIEWRGTFYPLRLLKEGDP